MIRKVLFWVHLSTGLVAGLVIFVMSFTGAALALQPQVLGWVERDRREVSVLPDVEQLGPQALIARVKVQRPNEVVTGLTVDRDRAKAAMVTLAPAVTVYVNPYSGALTGVVQQTGARKFFRVMTDWHRWLAQEGATRSGARWVTGISNAAFLGLAVTGLFLWWPRVWTWASISAVALFRRNVGGRARDFNWHNVIGAWSAPVLIVLTFTAMCISFPKTYEVIYAVTGLERPAPAPARAAVAGSTPASIIPAGLDAMWTMAQRQMPSWKSINVRLPQANAHPVTFTITDLRSINSIARSTLTLDASSGRLLKWDPYELQPAGQRLRTWMRFGHTGELWGPGGQIVAGAASLGGCVLVWTGMALAVRRWSAWRVRRARRLASVVDDQLAA